MLEDAKSLEIFEERRQLQMVPVFRNDTALGCEQTRRADEFEHADVFPRVRVGRIEKYEIGQQAAIGKSFKPAERIDLQDLGAAANLRASRDSSESAPKRARDFR